MDWIATPKQAAFLSADEDEVLYGGAAGGGKSDGLLLFAILRAQAIPKSRHLILRQTFPELERSLILRSYALLTGIGRYQTQQHRWKLPNGSLIEFAFCEVDRDVYQFQSAEFETICFDELTEFSEYQYRFLFSRLRTTKPGVRCLMRAGTNPGGPGHLWVKTRFVDAAPAGQRFTVEMLTASGVKRQTARFVPATLDDNPHLNREEYETRLAMLPANEARALRYGDWDVFAGQYLSEWRREIHVVPEREIPDWWLRFRSLDYGLDMTACYWWAVDSLGNEFIYRELYQPGLMLSEAARRIVELTPEQERPLVRYTVASPDLWNRERDRGESGYEIMTRAGLAGLIPADARRVPGWRALREHLKPFRGPDGVVTAKLRVFSDCLNLIRTVPALVHDAHNPEDAAQGEDHAAESVRYGVMSRPAVASEPGKTAPAEESRRKRAMREAGALRPTGDKYTGY